MGQIFHVFLILENNRVGKGAMLAWGTVAPNPAGRPRDQDSFTLRKRHPLTFLCLGRYVLDVGDLDGGDGFDDVATDMESSHKNCC